MVLLEYRIAAAHRAQNPAVLTFPGFQPHNIMCRVVDKDGVGLAGTRHNTDNCKSDILWRDTAGDVELWLMNGTQILQSATFKSVPTNWSVIGQRSFTGNGDSDILWRDTARSTTASIRPYTVA
jgi:hypothetical protein